MEELRCCPFCGAKAQLEQGMERVYPIWRVKCTSDQCGAEIAFGENFKERAIEAWNRRADDGHKNED